MVARVGVGEVHNGTGVEVSGGQSSGLLGLVAAAHERANRGASGALWVAGKRADSLV